MKSVLGDLGGFLDGKKGPSADEGYVTGEDVRRRGRLIPMGRSESKPIWTRVFLVVAEGAMR